MEHGESALVDLTFSSTRLHDLGDFGLSPVARSSISKEFRFEKGKKKKKPGNTFHRVGEQDVAT